MKFTKLFMFFAAGAFALTGCNNDDNGGTTEESNFYLKMTREDLTRADAAAVADGTEVVFNEGALFFVDGSENIVRYVRITNDFATGTVSTQELEDGHLFAGINASATHVHIVGNYNFDGQTSFGNLSQLRAITKDLIDETDSNYGVSNATLYGSSELKVATPSAANKFANREATVKLAPLIARLEIAKVSAKSSSDVGDGFKLEGIYIDGFYYTSSVIADYSNFKDIPYKDAATVSGTYPDVASYLAYSRFNDGNSTTFGVYTDADWYPILFDDGDEASSTTTNGLGIAGTAPWAAYSVEPAKDAWAYNIYADATYVPYIILHLTNVKINGTDYPNSKTGTPGEAYLTVTGYRTSNGSVLMEGGYIYKIANIEFDEDNLREEPKGPDPTDPDPQEKLDVFVTVELMKWTALDVEVEFN